MHDLNDQDHGDERGQDDLDGIGSFEQSHEVLWLPTPEEAAEPTELDALEGRSEDELGWTSVHRRNVLRVAAIGATTVAATATGILGTPYLKGKGLLSPDGAFAATSTQLGDNLFYVEAFPTSPLIMSPFTDPLVIPKALVPISSDANNVDSWKGWKSVPGKGRGAQNGGTGLTDSLTGYGNETHQRWCDSVDGKSDPNIYRLEVKIAQHSFTSSEVLPIDSKGKPTFSFDANGNKVAAGVKRKLPPSTIFGFNGQFPGPMINAEYGTPNIVRFINKLDENPDNLDLQDFGAPDRSFLTHLHNGHTAPESDGNPHYSMRYGPGWAGYRPGQWVDNLYLNWPAAGDDREKQSFFWFHDHRMDHTGSNVYKGLVGLYPIYDPKLDFGDETNPNGLRLPGIRKDEPDGSFNVQYDIPLAFYDCRLDDGVTTHQDVHDQLGEFPAAKNPRTHPEWWGKTFFKHFPNHGFVGDIFTVNGTAYPTMTVDRRKYRLRFLDCSVARIYEFKLMTSTKGPQSSVSLGYQGDELDGQYRIEDAQQCMKFTQIASDGGLLPAPVVRDSFELWPAKRREFIVDFTKYMDGSPTKKGDVIYLTNVLKMPTGRMWSNSSRFSPDPKYKVPMMKIIIGDPPKVADQSVIPTKMRDLPPLPSNWKDLLDNRLVFEVQRGSGGGEIEWLINGRPFNPATPETSLRNPAGKTPLAQQPKGSFNLWEIRNGGGGWVHPFHLHMEEHRTVMRNNRDVTKGDPSHPDDVSREDLIALDPSESVIVYRGFRDFTGPYVAHCHNLAHEDHAMMFGWEIT